VAAEKQQEKLKMLISPYNVFVFNNRPQKWLPKKKQEKLKILISPYNVFVFNNRPQKWQQKKSKGN